MRQSFRRGLVALLAVLAIPLAGCSGSGDGRLLFVTNAEMAIDVYSLPNGEYMKTLTSGGLLPIMLYGAN